MNKNHLRLLLFLFVILGMFIFTILSGTEKLDAINPQTDKWQTTTGDWREPSQTKSFLHQTLGKSGTSALSVAVIQNSQVVFYQSIGIIDKKTDKHVGEQTVFRTASLSKSAFAYLVLE